VINVVGSLEVGDLIIQREALITGFTTQKGSANQGIEPSKETANLGR
jgi:hypothetical protein